MFDMPKKKSIKSDRKGNFEKALGQFYAIQYTLYLISMPWCDYKLYYAL